MRELRSLDAVRLCRPGGRTGSIPLEPVYFDHRLKICSFYRLEREEGSTRKGLQAGQTSAKDLDVESCTVQIVKLLRLAIYETVAQTITSPA
jgi:hypothetical protein